MTIDFKTCATFVNPLQMAEEIRILNLKFRPFTSLSAIPFLDFPFLFLLRVSIFRLSSDEANKLLGLKTLASALKFELHSVSFPKVYLTTSNNCVTAPYGAQKIRTKHCNLRLFPTVLHKNLRKSPIAVKNISIQTIQLL